MEKKMKTGSEAAATEEGVKDRRGKREGDSEKLGQRRRVTARKSQTNLGVRSSIGPEAEGLWTGRETGRQRDIKFGGRGLKFRVR